MRLKIRQETKNDFGELNRFFFNSTIYYLLKPLSISKQNNNSLLTGFGNITSMWNGSSGQK